MTENRILNINAKQQLIIKAYLETLLAFTVNNAYISYRSYVISCVFYNKKIKHTI